jgi:hypothetical protein
MRIYARLIDASCFANFIAMQRHLRAKQRIAAILITKKPLSTILNATLDPMILQPRWCAGGNHTRANSYLDRGVDMQLEMKYGLRK